MKTFKGILILVAVLLSVAAFNPNPSGGSGTLQTNNFTFNTNTIVFYETEDDWFTNGNSRADLTINCTIAGVPETAGTVTLTVENVTTTNVIIKMTSLTEASANVNYISAPATFHMLLNPNARFKIENTADPTTGNTVGEVQWAVW